MKKKILIIALSFVVILGIGATLAYLRGESGSQNNNTITLADFHVDLLTDITSVNIPAMYPMSDTEGLTQTPITFAIKNNGEITANYKVSLVDKDTVSTLLNPDVRYRLKRTVGSEAQETFDIKNLDSTGVIDSGSIGVGVTITYELVMWQDYDSTANNKTFSKVILVEGMQSSNLDTSGANFPELLENMIPVYYEATTDTTGVWKKADSTNLNSSYKWFDYDTSMWANAVTVKSTGTHDRDYYLEAEEGTTIEMDDITTMWVWIPRYKYIIFNGNNGTVSEQEIKVMFEHGTDTTGTVKCHDDILTSNNSEHSEVCTDTTNGSIINHKSTYTHPAFCFGTKDESGNCDGEEITGFWMAKFEMSTDDSTCNTTFDAADCNRQGLNILVKPDVYSLRYENVSISFANIRRMETYGNIHGFSQSESATTWVDENSKLTGEINNDNNNFDTHMIKNMEWGAVAYLSESNYGKQGNSLYTGDYKEVYVNNNSNSKTGYSGGSYDSAASSSSTYLYNNLTSNGTGQGYIGAGASTTGTVYGVYDMSGCNNEVLMINYDTFSTDAPNWSSEVYPIEKYYDKYSNFFSASNAKLGDATKEVIDWYGDRQITVSNQNLPYLSRSYQYSNTTQAGIYSFAPDNGNASEYSSSRPVLTITRNMPWRSE